MDQRFGPTGFLSVNNVTPDRFTLTRVTYQFLYPIEPQTETEVESLSKQRLLLTKAPYYFLK